MIKHMSDSLDSLDDSLDFDGSLDAADDATLAVATQWSELCSYVQTHQQDPWIITGFLRLALISRFLTDERREHYDIKRVVWSPDEKRTGILIESHRRWRRELTQLRPACLIKQQGYKNERLLLGDKAYVDEHGNQNYATFWTGAHTIFCLSRLGSQAEILASEVQHELTEFGPVFCRELRLHRFLVAEVGAAGQLEEDRTNYVVPVNVVWAYEESWVLPEHARTFRRILLDLDTQTGA